MYMKLNFWPFHKHDYKLLCWRLVHVPEWEPSRITMLVQCETCGNTRSKFHENERDLKWEEDNKHLEAWWFNEAGNIKWAHKD